MRLCVLVLGDSGFLWLYLFLYVGECSKVEWKMVWFEGYGEDFKFID